MYRYLVACIASLSVSCGNFAGAFYVVVLFCLHVRLGASRLDDLDLVDNGPLWCVSLSIQSGFWYCTALSARSNCILREILRE